MSRLSRALTALVPRTLRSTSPGSTSPGSTSRRRTAGRKRRGFVAAPAPADVHAEDLPTVSYAVEADSEPDPGEVVWGWVPYEDDPSQGKDRPVLLLGHHRDQWVGLMLTSKDRARGVSGPDRYGRVYMDVGTGGWDREGRPSEVRLDRLVRLDDAAIRREGAALPRAVFDRVVARARDFHHFA